MESVRCGASTVGRTFTRAWKEQYCMAYCQTKIKEREPPTPNLGATCAHHDQRTQIVFEIWRNKFNERLEGVVFKSK
jgi:hypothetical protein